MTRAAMSAGHHACTIVARNYVAQARVLARSFHAEHTVCPFYTLIIDGSEEDRALPGLGIVLLPSDLGLAPETVHSMQVIYDVMEYATALKPALLSHLIRSGASAAAYFDPDIQVYDNLSDVFVAAEQTGIVLTPHTLDPVPRDGANLGEQAIMHSGMYNLGFIAVGPGALRFLAWWHERLTTDAVVDLAQALFTDQRWVDWAPALFAPTICRDRGLNVAYWNLHERPISRDADGRPRAGDARLRFFHFSGYDPAQPWVLSKHLGHNPRTLLSENPALHELCDAYGAELVRSGHVQMRRNAYRHSSLPGGPRLTPLVRRLYRDALTGRCRELGDAPDPVADPAAFREWLLSPSIRAGTVRLSRVELALWRSRVDLQAAFPDVLGMSSTDYRGWLDAEPSVAEVYAELRLPRPSGDGTVVVDRRPVRRRSPLGWSVLGYARAELGVGEAGRRVSRAIAHTGVPWEMVGVSIGPESRQEHSYRGDLSAEVHHDNALLCVNADQTLRMSRMLGLERLAGRRVGYWFWELETFPEQHLGALDAVDEVWVASDFTRASVAAVTDKPVHILNLPVTPPARPTPYTRALLGLPQDATVFLVNLDYLSVMERKNPLAAIRAYCDAFPRPDGRTVLVVKSINGHLRPLDRERVRLAARGRSDIHLWDGYLTGAQMQGLTELVDCVVSLHRSEGYGLNLVDAMACGTPVIATGYSGNLAFMDEDTAMLVPYDMVAVGPHAAPYDPRGRWAEPDTTAASVAMRRVVDDREGVQDMTVRALRHLERFRPDRIALDLRESLLPAAMTSAQTRMGVR